MFVVLGLLSICGRCCVCTPRGKGGGDEPPPTLGASEVAPLSAFSAAGLHRPRSPHRRTASAQGGMAAHPLASNTSTARTYPTPASIQAKRGDVVKMLSIFSHFLLTFWFCCDILLTKDLLWPCFARKCRKDKIANLFSFFIFLILFSLQNDFFAL